MLLYAVSEDVKSHCHFIIQVTKTLALKLAGVIKSGLQWLSEIPQWISCICFACKHLFDLLRFTPPFLDPFIRIAGSLYDVHCVSSLHSHVPLENNMLICKVSCLVTLTTLLCNKGSGTNHHIGHLSFIVTPSHNKEKINIMHF